jgi:hypothetical protein
LKRSRYLAAIVLKYLALSTSLRYSHQLLSKHNLQQKSALLSMSNANIAIARRFLDELWNERKFEVADEIFSEDFVTYSISNDPPVWEGKGPDSMRTERLPKI